VPLAAAAIAKQNAIQTLIGDTLTHGQQTKNAGVAREKFHKPTGLSGKNGLPFVKAVL
jgi:hypothetical protein